MDISNDFRSPCDKCQISFNSSVYCAKKKLMRISVFYLLPTPCVTDIGHDYHNIS